MKNQLGLLVLLGTCLSLGCSSDGGKFGAGAVGGTTSNGGTGGASGPAPGDPRDSGLSYTGGGTNSYSGTSPFGELTAPGNAYFDPNDPCTAVIPWITGTVSTISDGNLASVDGTVYEYSTTNSSCNDPMTYMMADCAPGLTGTWCSQCWTLRSDLTCPELTVDPAILGTGGAGGATGAGGTTSGT